MHRALKGNLNTVQSSHNFLCVAIHVSNFQVATKGSTHITFYWDSVDGYYTSSYISYFYPHLDTPVNGPGVQTGGRGPNLRHRKLSCFRGGPPRDHSVLKGQSDCLQVT